MRNDSRSGVTWPLRRIADFSGLLSLLTVGNKGSSSSALEVVAKDRANVGVGGITGVADCVELRLRARIKASRPSLKDADGDTASSVNELLLVAGCLEASEPRRLVRSIALLILAEHPDDWCYQKMPQRGGAGGWKCAVKEGEGGRSIAHLIF